jgi:hypothetical protein
MSKSFNLEQGNHKIHVSFEPSHIKFDIFDKNNHKSKTALFYDETLPTLVKEECEYVSDLYEFL